MRKRTSRKILASLMALVLTAAMFVGFMPAGEAFAVTQQQVDALKAERDAIIAKREAKQKVVEELEAEQADIVAKKQAMDERNQLTIQQIELNSEEIALYADMIEQKAEEVEEAKELEKEQLARYRSRIRAMEENGNLGFLAVLLDSDNIGEFLTAMDDMGEIMESDKQLEKQYVEARQNTEKIKAEYEVVKQDLEAKQEELRSEQAELEKQIEEAYQMLAEVEADLDSHMEEFQMLEQWEAEACDAFNQMAAELQRQKEEEARRQQAANAGSGGGGGGSSIVGTGQFAWPTPSCSTITSYYGYRIHPVYGYEKFHSGVDIGAADGASIVAADDGTVAFAGVMGGYGNCVMIDHGNGYTTLYAHMSSYAVYEGQTVSKSHIIGFVGSTGVATGPHLHYEIRSGGECIDPMGFY